MSPVIVPGRRSGAMRFAMRASIPITDDAGVEHRLVRFGEDPAPDLAHPLTQASLARLRSAASDRPGGPVLRWMVTLVVACSIVVPTVILGTVALARWARLPPWALMGVLIGAAAIVVNGAIVFLPRIASRALAGRTSLMVDAILRMRRCAACGYPLAADAEPSDHVHRCSECGATWRDERLGSDVVPSGDPGFTNSFVSVFGISAASRSRKRDDAGRPYAEPPRLSHSRMPQLPGDRQVWRVTRRAVLLFVASIPSGVLMLLGAALLIGAGVHPAIPTLMVLYAIVVTPVAIISSLRAQTSLRRRVLLSWRRCPACRGRLARDGSLLHCAGCDATWRRPARRGRIVSGGRG